MLNEKEDIKIKIKAERIMLTMSTKLKGKIEAISEDLGINTTQYIINLIINDLNQKKLSK